MKENKVNLGVISLLILAGVLLYLVAKNSSLTVTLITALFLGFYLLMVLKPIKS